MKTQQMFTDIEYGRRKRISRRLREMTDKDIAAIAETVSQFCEGALQAEKGFCAAASTEEIAGQGYILTPGRYVGIAEDAGDGEPFGEKMTRLSAELSGLFVESHKLEKEIKKRLGAIGWKV
ncbi:MAG: N-6 DNA methylase [Spirochaetaceae bacterium]|nr:N-6 DNA methylase [Spirochaetaceae bacterium]